MLTATFKDLQSHSRELVDVVQPLRSSNLPLIHMCVPDKSQTAVSIRIGDEYDSLADGQSQFATKLAGVLGAYFEVWARTAANSYSLHKAYLHLEAATTASSAPRQLVLVHTEPTEPEDPADPKKVRLARWRTGPHMHVKASSFGIGSCHFHLDTCTLPCKFLTSLRAYRESLQKTVEMISDELEEYFDPSQS